MNGKDRAKRHDERRGLRQEARETEMIAPRDTRNGEDCAKRHEGRRGLRQETRGSERIVPTGTRNEEERAKSPVRDHAKRHKEQKRECGATRKENGKVPCRNEQ